MMSLRIVVRSSTKTLTIIVLLAVTCLVTFAATGDDDVRALCGAGERDAATDTGRGACDHDGPTVERLAHGAITAPPSTNSVAPLIPSAPGPQRNSTAPATSSTGS